MDARVIGLMALTLGGCGASVDATRNETTTPVKASEEATGPSSDPNSIPSEKFDEIDQFFHRKAAQIQFTCYDREVEKDGKKYEGNVNFSVVVMPGGKVGEIKVTGSTLKSPAIEQCAIAEMKTWEWPDVPANAPYTGSINFKPAW